MDVDNCVLGAITVSSTLIEVTQQYHQAIRLQLEKVAFCSHAGWNCRVVSNKFSLLTVHVGRIQDGGISMIPMSRTALIGINFNTECISFFDFVH